jgi:type I restriction enzyme S subunit
MITADLERYAIYKDTEIESLGEMPTHWTHIRLKSLAQIIDGDRGSEYPNENDFTENGIPFLSSFDIQNNKLNLSNVRFISEEKFKKLRKGKLRNNDLIITVRGTIGSTALFKNDPFETAFINAQMMIIRLNKQNFIPQLLNYASTARFWLQQLEMLAYGSAQKQLNIDIVKNLFLYYPPFEEQQAIADYLDAKTKQIDRKIELLEAKAEKYANLKQSLINETVTCGLDKTAPMKDSGVEWIGQIPAHWEMKRLKDIANIQNSNVDKKSHEHETPVRLCNYVDVYKNEYIDSSLDFMKATADEFEIRRFGIKKNDVLITKDSETFDDIAVPALAVETLEDVICGYHLAQIRTNQKILSGAYLFRLFQSQRYGFRFMVNAKGITRVGLGQSAIADALTPIPPLTEQGAIVEFLESKTAQIEKIVETINLEVEKLYELRKTLINDVVTGKIKVSTVHE